MISSRLERKYLALSLLPCYALDIVLTLIGQPSSYWAGQRHELIEQNPIGAWLLQIHPAAFIITRDCLCDTIYGGNLSFTPPHRLVDFRLSAPCTHLWDKNLALAVSLQGPIPGGNV